MYRKRTNTLGGMFAVLYLLVTVTQSALAEEVWYKDIKLSFVDAETDAPIHGAEVNYYRRTYPSDGRGKLVLPLKIKDYGTYFYARAESYTPRRIRWRSPDPSQYPDSYTVKMQKGVTIGGTIVDADGSPIEGATVFILGTDSDMGDDPRIFDDKPFVWDEEVLTDAEGHWVYHLFPADRERASLRLSHPNYITEDHYKSCANLAALKAQALELKMKRGLTLQGIVRDPNGNPVANAFVFQGESRYGSAYPETKTDQSGTFTFPQAKEGEMVLTVIKPGWAPELVVVEVTATSSDPVEIRLKHGTRVELTVVNPDGQPVHDAWVMPDSWREKSPDRIGDPYRTLADVSRATHDAGKLRYNKHTDEQGRFIWTWAPEEPVQYAVLKPGMMSQRDVTLSAAESKKTVVLYPALSIHGRVTDRATGDDIERFNVLHAHAPETRKPNFITGFPVSGKNGRYAISFDEADNYFWVKIEAKGYAPVSSRPVALTESEVAINFELDRAGQ